MSDAWRAKQRAQKEEERIHTMKATEQLREYRGQLSEEDAKIAAQKQEELRQKKELESQLRNNVVVSANDSNNSNKFPLLTGSGRKVSKLAAGFSSPSPLKQSQEGLEKLQEQKVQIDSIVGDAGSKLVRISKQLNDDFDKIQDGVVEEEQYLSNNLSSNVLQYGVDLDPRTQAMVAEDSFLAPKDNSNIDDSPPEKGMDKRSTLALNLFRIDRKLRAGRGSSDSTDADDALNNVVIRKEASFEIPLEVTNYGFKLPSHVADLTMTTTIPPSRTGGRFSAELEGKSSLGTNTASGLATLEYKSSKHTCVMCGMIRGCGSLYPLMTAGGRLERRGSALKVMLYQNADISHQSILMNKPSCSFSFKHRFFRSKWIISSQLSRQRELSVSITNSKISSFIGWNLIKPSQFFVRVEARPKLSASRRAHLYCQWKSGAWNFGLSLFQSLHSHIATVGLGWRVISTRGLEWVVSWSRGNATICIPIVLSSNLAPNATFVQTMYVSLVSHIIQEYIAEIWGWIGNEATDVEAASPIIATQNRLMARRDAIIQKELMCKQASRRTKEEKDKNGLIIREAIYTIQGGDEWDVTIPLQFLIKNSTLKLPARRKSELLGFYDLSAFSRNVHSLPVESNVPWRIMLDDLFDWTPKNVLLRKKAVAELPSPTLLIRYEFKGQPFQLIVKDREKVLLP